MRLNLRGFLNALLCAAIFSLPIFFNINQLQANARPCITKNFSTEMYKNACAKGGQKSAKATAKLFGKEKKIKTCSHCHEKLAPQYQLKKNALKQFKKIGGR